ncbi:hypothetical protein Ae201684P_020485 [Aphanomyces euteiches]|uniref:Uncharacterized protein n=1 Tax=Aphanomyces euteiches TaxID=100861 RepID=A0A6G0WEJ2_9STRA|nr:hypothetical protein Ae201684_016570 [Aphanomyces euteiches]KAH9084236.1 hypothetical protein Ae201684P_020485 [Aphanomyces euteiches]
MRAVVLYVSAVMLAVAGVTLVYIGLFHGHVEVLNLLELNRVGAIVWIGRPLLFIRSLTALSLLSTATVQLVYNGNETSFREVKNSFVKIVLAANEVTWTVAILNDILMIWTQEYTIYYATMNSVLVWSYILRHWDLSNVTRQIQRSLWVVVGTDLSRQFGLDCNQLGPSIAMI